MIGSCCFVLQVLETLPLLPSVRQATTAPGDRNLAPLQDWSVLRATTAHRALITPSCVTMEPIKSTLAKMAALLVQLDTSVMLHQVNKKIKSIINQWDIIIFYLNIF